MTLYRAQVMDTPDDPFRGGALRADADAGLLVLDGVIVERGPYADVRRGHPDETVVDLSSGLLLPGFVDTHVHYPQMRASSSPTWPRPKMATAGTTGSGSSSTVTVPPQHWTPCS